MCPIGPCLNCVVFLVNFVVVIDVVCGACPLELSILLCASEIPPGDHRALAWSVGELGGAMCLLRTQRKRPVMTVEMPWQDSFHATVQCSGLGPRQNAGTLHCS
jgi:hypothetical protein